MKTRTRLAVAFTAVVASLFTAAPAFAHEGVVEHVNEFSSAGQPVDVVAISIVGLVLLAFVLVSSTLIGNLFEKK